MHALDFGKRTTTKRGNARILIAFIYRFYMFIIAHRLSAFFLILFPSIIGMPHTDTTYNIFKLAKHNRHQLRINLSVLTSNAGTLAMTHTHTNHK